MNDGIILRTSPEFTALRKNLPPSDRTTRRTARRAAAFDSFETYLTSERGAYDFRPLPPQFELPRQPADSLYDHQVRFSIRNRRSSNCSKRISSTCDDETTEGRGRFCPPPWDMTYGIVGCDLENLARSKSSRIDICAGNAHAFPPNDFRMASAMNTNPVQTVYRDFVLRIPAHDLDAALIHLFERATSPSIMRRMRRHGS